MFFKKLSVGILLFVGFSQSVSALTWEEKEQESMEKITNGALAGAAFKKISDAFLVSSRTSALNNAELMDAMIKLKQYVHPIEEQLKYISLEDVYKTRLELSDIKHTNLSSAAKLTKLKSFVTNLGVGLDVLSLATGIYDVVQNVDKAFDETGSPYDMAEARGKVVMGVLGTYQATVGISAVIAQKLPASAVASFWSKNAIAKGVTYGPLSVVMLGAQIESVVYQAYRDEAINDIGKAIQSLSYTAMSNRMKTLTALFELYIETSKNNEMVNYGHIINITDDYRMYYKVHSAIGKSTSLTTLLRERIQSEYLLENYNVSAFGDLSNEERIHVALDALIEITIYEDRELEALLDKEVTNGSTAADVIFGAFGSSIYDIYDTLSFKKKLFPYYNEESTLTYYDRLYKMSFDTVVNNYTKDALYELGKETKRLQDAQARDEYLAAEFSRFLEVPATQAGDKIAIYFGLQVEYSDKLIYAYANDKTLRFRYYDDTTLHIVDANFDYDNGYFVFDAPTQNPIRLIEVIIPSEPWYDGDTSDHPVTYSLPVGNNGVSMQVVPLEGDGGGGDDDPDVTADNPLKQTGQTTSYQDFDDGYYKAGTTPSYSRSEVGVVTDNVTKLEWQDDVSSVQKQWLTDENYDAGNYNNTSGDTATTYCSTLELDGGGWRLPTRKELVSLSKYGNHNPAINSVFKNVVSSYYWSSAVYMSNSSNAWGIDFNYGNQNNNDKDNSFCARCVRAGEVE